jgi:hypothetical protein
MTKRFCQFGCAEHVCNALDVVCHRRKADLPLAPDNPRTSKRGCPKIRYLIFAMECFAVHPSGSPVGDQQGASPPRQLAEVPLNRICLVRSQRAARIGPSRAPSLVSATTATTVAHGSKIYDRHCYHF